MVFRYVFKAAFEDRTELGEGIGVDISVFAQTVKLSAADVIFVQQLVLRDPAFFHRLPKPIKDDHPASTGNAKYCLSATAERDGMELIAAIMAAPSSKERFADAATLLNFGFANYSLYNAAEDLSLSDVPVILGKNACVGIKPSGSTYVLTEKSKTSSLVKNIEITENVKAPVKEGQTLGKIEILSDGEILQTIPLVASEEVEKLGFAGIFKKFAEVIFMK